MGTILGPEQMLGMVVPSKYTWVYYFTGNDDDANQALNQAINAIVNVADNVEDYLDVSSMIDEIVKYRLEAEKLLMGTSELMAEYESIGGGLEARALSQREIMRTASIEKRIAGIAERGLLRGAEERVLGRDIVRTVERRASMWRRIGRAVRFLL